MLREDGLKKVSKQPHKNYVHYKIINVQAFVNYYKLTNKITKVSSDLISPLSLAQRGDGQLFFKWRSYLSVEELYRELTIDGFERGVYGEEEL